MTFRSLFIVGGSGFLGSAICKEAIQSGWKVTSLSRHGCPPRLASYSWSKKITWLKGNVHDPSSYEHRLEQDDINTVIHSMGLLFEIPFMKSGSISYQKTYKHENRDSLITLSSTCSKFPLIKSFGYVSACHQIPPFLPKGYISSKIEAEKALLASRFESYIFRPGMMYSSTKPAVALYAIAMNTLLNLPKVESLFPWMTRPLSVELVAKAITMAMSKESLGSSIFEIQDLVNVYHQS